MQDSLRHIDWVDLDNIIITSSKKTYYDKFLDQVKNLQKKVRIIRLITTDDNSFDKILVIENKFFYYIDYQKRSNDYFIKLVTEINSDGFINIYKQFNREIILNDILKDVK